MNQIHPTAIVGPDVKLGKNNYIGPFCIIENADIGDNNRFEAHCCIGAPPQYLGFIGSLATAKTPQKWKVVIGDNNKFREFVTIHCGTAEQTVIGDGNFLMNYVHVAHDCNIENNITIANNTQIAGHTLIQSKCNIGLSAVIHQFSFLGEGCMIGMGTVIPKKKRILPYKVYVGVPAKEIKDNQYLIDKNKVDEKTLVNLRKAYNSTFNEFYLK